MTRLLGAAALLVAVTAGPAHAQKHQHDHTRPGPHGGQVMDAGAWHAELVVEGQVIHLFMSGGDHAPLPAAGFAGTAILVVDGKPVRVALAPDGNKLTGTLPKGFKGKPRGAVRLVGPGGATASAKVD